MAESASCLLVTGKGLDVETRGGGVRQVTLLSVEAWDDVCAELGAELPWHTRRANLFIGGIDLAATVGCVVTIGEARLRIHGESKPCNVMDQQHQGLRAALRPHGRGGVFAEVLTGGTIRIDDVVVIDGSSFKALSSCPS